MSENLTIWNTLGRTSPDQTKGFSRAGGFRGTAVKPVYTEQKMTELFGPCGIGWGFSEPTFQLVPGSDGQTAVYCWLSLWYVHDGARSQPVPGVGGDMVIVKQSSGLRTDDEAFKKAFTDAIGNAMKHIGMSADVHMGRFDDSKYVNELRREDAEANSPSAPMPGRNAPVSSGTKPAHSETGATLSDADQDTLVSATKSAGKLCADPGTLRNWWISQIPKVKPNLSLDRFEGLKVWVADTAATMGEREAA
jgi:hypothetical protein